MSIRCITDVLDKSQHKGSARLLMVVIADFASDDGEAFPSIATLARKTKLTERAVQLLLKTLTASGELSIHPGEGLRGTHLYIIHRDRLGGGGGEKITGEKISGVKSFRGEKRPNQGVKKLHPAERETLPEISPDPSCDPSGKEPPPEDAAVAAGGDAAALAESLEYLRSIDVQSPRHRQQLAAAFSLQLLRQHWQHWQRTNPGGRIGAFVTALSALPPGTAPPAAPESLAMPEGPPPAINPPPDWLAGLIPDWNTCPEQARRWLGHARYDPEQRRIVAATDQITSLLHQRYAYLLTPVYAQLGGSP